MIAEDVSRETSGAAGVRVSRETSAGVGDSDQSPTRPNHGGGADADDGLLGAPAVARTEFADEAVALLSRFAELLAGPGVERGLLGPREVPRLWDRHLLNCAVTEPLFAPASTVCDIGSGAGLPGVVLAVVRPDLQLTLVEPLLRRAVFLGEVVDRLELANVEVVRERADALHGVRTFDAVTSRAVAPLSRLVGWCMPLVSRSGQMHALKGSRASEEIVDAGAAITKARCGSPQISEWGAGIVSPQTVVVSLARTTASY